MEPSKAYFHQLSCRVLVSRTSPKSQQNTWQDDQFHLHHRHCSTRLKHPTTGTITTIWCVEVCAEFLKKILFCFPLMSLELNLFKEVAASRRWANSTATGPCMDAAEKFIVPEPGGLVANEDDVTWHVDFLLLLRIHHVPPVLLWDQTGEVRESKNK